MEQSGNFSQRGTVVAEDLHQIFEASLMRIGKVVAILDTWRAPVYLTRIWTIYEQFTAIRCGIEVTITMPAPAATSLLDEISTGKQGII